MIDLSTETPLTLAQAARRFPPGRGGRPTHTATVYRWLSEGARTPCGRVRLDAVRVGGRWVTTVEAIQRFIDASTPDFAAADPTPAPRTPRARRRASERAERELSRIGI